MTHNWTEIAEQESQNLMRTKNNDPLTKIEEFHIAKGIRRVSRQLTTGMPSWAQWGRPN